MLNEKINLLQTELKNIQILYNNETNNLKNKYEKSQKKNVNLKNKLNLYKKTIKSLKNTNKVLKKYEQDDKEIKKYENELDDNCCICTMNKKVNICIPCGHICLCYSCSSKYPKDFQKCPLCRTIIKGIYKVAGIQTDEKVYHIYSLGDYVKAHWKHDTTSIYNAKITKLNPNGSYSLEYEDGDINNNVFEDYIIKLWPWNTLDEQQEDNEQIQRVIEASLNHT